MAVCKNCGTNNGDKAIFCASCGERILKSNYSPTSKERGVVCKNCGTVNSPNSMFCQECDYKLPRITQAVNPTTNSYVPKSYSTSTKKKSFLIPLGIIIYVATVIIGYFLLDTYFQERDVFDYADDWYSKTSDVLFIKEETELYRDLFIAVSATGLNLGTVLICTGSIKNKL